MSLSRGAVESISGLADKPTVVTVDNRQHLVLKGEKAWERQNLDQPAVEPEALAVSTLSAFVDYCKANRDALDLEEMVVHILDHRRVALRGKLAGLWSQRFCYVFASAPVVEGFTTGMYMALDKFVVMLLAHCVQSDARDALVKLFTNVKEESVRTSQDDGVSQVVTARNGVAIVSEAKVPNPTALAPFRTFANITQPESPFVLRVKQGEGDGVKAALFEGDGGAWKITATEAIRAYLKAELAETKLIVIA